MDSPTKDPQDRKKALITIRVNGKDRTLPNATPLLAFLATLEVDTQFIAVAYNGEVLNRSELQFTMVGQGDVLEIVRAVGGG